MARPQAVAWAGARRAQGVASVAALPATSGRVQVGEQNRPSPAGDGRRDAVGSSGRLLHREGYRLAGAALTVEVELDLVGPRLARLVAVVAIVGGVRVEVGL